MKKPERDSEIPKGFHDRGFYRDSRNYKPGSMLDAEKAVAKQTAEKIMGSDSIRHQESAGSGLYNPISTAKNAGRGFSLKNFSARKKPLALMVILLLLGVGGGGTFFFGAALAPFAFVQNVVEDLTDTDIGVNKASTRLYKAKVPGQLVSEVVKGCSKLSIRCKFKTLSKTEVAFLERSGIKVEGTKNVFGRTIPKGYTFKNVTITDPGEFRAKLRTRGDPLGQAFLSSRNPKMLVYADNSFKSRVLKVFGVSKAKPGLKGSALDRANQLMTATASQTIDDVTFTPVDPEDSSKGYTLDGDSSGRTYTEDEFKSASKSLGRAANFKPPSKLTTGTVGALSIVGIQDLACSINNAIGGATIAAKIANKRELIQFGIPVLATVSAVQAGDPSVTREDAEAVGTFFTQKDVRETIVDLEGTLAENGFAANDDASVESLEYTNNPNINKSAMNSPLYAMSAGGDVPQAGGGKSRFALGLGVGGLLGGLENAADVISTVINYGSDKTVCKTVQSGWVRSVGLVVGIASSFIPGAGQVKLGAQIAIAAGLMAGMFILDQYLHSLLSGSIAPEDIAEDPVARGDMVWTSIAAVNEENSRVRGFSAVSNDDYFTYLESDKDDPTYNIAYNERGPFEYEKAESFLGKLSLSVYGQLSNFSLLSIPGLVINNISSVTRSADAANIVDPRRFELCDDRNYKEFGFTADVQCNLRYGLTPGDTALLDNDDISTDDIIDYMESGGYIQQDSVDGLPQGYTPPYDRGQKGLAETLLTSGVETFVNTVSLPNDYAKYLEYCAFRDMPMGDTYEETQGVSEDWLNGSRCSRDTIQMNFFRVFTLLNATQDGLDGGETIQAYNDWFPDDESVVKSEATKL